MANPATLTRIGSRRAISAQSPAPHVVLDGIPVFDGTLDDAVGWCLDRQAGGEGSRIATANLDFFALAQRDPILRADLEASSIVVADGTPIAWLARAVGARRVRRVAGVDFVRELARAGAANGPFRIALYGSTDDLTLAAGTYLERETGAVVVSRISPPFRAQTPDEVAKDVAALQATAADAVFVALGCPRQERFIAMHADVLPRAVWVGVGGTFDFFAGKRKRAPGFVQGIGAEWLVRMAQDPVRLGRRYLGRDLPALGRIILREIR